MQTQMPYRRPYYARGRLDGDNAEFAAELERNLQQAQVPSVLLPPGHRVGWGRVTDVSFHHEGPPGIHTYHHVCTPRQHRLAQKPEEMDTV